jgi:hypothetical protein
MVGGIYRQRMFDYVAAHPEGVDRAQVMAAVYYDDADGGPLHYNVIAVMAVHINRALEPYGYAIRGSGGPHSRYRLVDVVPGPAVVMA